MKIGRHNTPNTKINQIGRWQVEGETRDRQRETTIMMARIGNGRNKGTTEDKREQKEQRGVP